MAYVSIPKDLTVVKSKFLFGLTRRQTICFGAAAAVGLPLFFLLRGNVPTSAAAFLMILVMLPFFLFAMYEKHGMPLEKFIKCIIAVKFQRPKIRTYQTSNQYTAVGRQIKLYKQEQRIVTVPKKNIRREERAGRGK